MQIAFETDFYAPISASVILSELAELAVMGGHEVRCLPRDCGRYPHFESEWRKEHPSLYVFPTDPAVGWSGTIGIYPEGCVRVVHEDMLYLSPVPDGVAMQLVVIPWTFECTPKHLVDRALADDRRRFFGTGAWTCQCLRNAGIPEDRIFQHVVSVDPDVFAPGAEPDPDVPEEPFVFLAVGNSVVASGYDILLEAYTKAFSVTDNVCLYVWDSCDGANAGIVEGVNSKSKPWVEYHFGFKPHSAMPSLYAAADAMVMPIRFHGACVPAIEALSCEVPLAITNYSGPADYHPATRYTFGHDMEPIWPAHNEYLKTGVRGMNQTGLPEAYGTEKMMPHWAKPRVDEVTEAMQMMYQDRRSLSKRALTRLHGRSSALHGRTSRPLSAKRLEKALKI